MTIILNINGPINAGKSTVSKLITGLYPAWSGEIKIDGVPLKDIPREVLRSTVSMVNQYIVTFHDTVSQNIKLWDDSIGDYEMILACRDADIHDEIVKRQGSYNSIILPGGKNFSGGQLQRFEIAHVLAERTGRTDRSSHYAAYSGSRHGLRCSRTSPEYDTGLR